MATNQPNSAAKANVSLDMVVERARSLVPVLRERAHDAEMARRIPDNTIADFMDAGILRTLQPARYGGYAFDYGTAQIAIAKELGRGCGSSAWVGVLIACHSWLLGMYPAEAQDEVWGPSPDTLVGTAFAAAQSKAELVDGGYRLSGRWQFASGIDHCAWVILGSPVMRENGPPDIRWFLLPKADYTVEDTWHAAGLRATGSNDVVVDDVFVPAHRTMSLDDLHGGPTAGSAVNPEAIYALPVMMVFPYNVYAPMLGTALGCIEAFIERTRERTGRIGRETIAKLPTIQMRVSESAAELDCATTLTERDAADYNALAKAGDPFDVGKRVVYRRNVAYAAMLCCRAVDRVVQVLGAQGVAANGIEQRAFRDVHAMSAHIAVQWDVNGVGYAENAFGLEISDKRL